jgi:hypothetical protein
MSLVRIHCYGCDCTVPVEEDAMSHGLQSAGWALDHGQTYCPACARLRNLSVIEAELPRPDSDADGTPVLEHGATPGQASGSPTGQALEPFPVTTALRERRGPRATRLLAASFSVLREDPQLLVFPAVAMALTFVLGALSFALSVSHGGGSRHARDVIFFASLVSAYPITFVSLYCGVALAAVLAGRLDGKRMTTHDGWMAAKERVGIIAAWTLVVCTVGAALRLIERYVPLGAKIVIAVVDLSWTLATMFAVPVLAYENLGPRDVLRRSSHIFRQRWGTQIGGIVSISVGSVFMYVPFIVLLVAGMDTAGATGTLLVVVGGAGMFGAIAVQVAMDQVFRVFVYRSAVGLDTTAGPFSQSDLQAPFTRRRSR